MASRIAIAARLPLHLHRATTTCSTPTYYLPSITSLHQRTTFTYARNNNNYDIGQQQDIRCNLNQQQQAQHYQTHSNSDLMENWQDDVTPRQSAAQSASFHTSQQVPFLTYSSNISKVQQQQQQPGSIAFGECEISALSDLFLQFAKTSSEGDDRDGKGASSGGEGGDDTFPYLNLPRIKLLLESVGEKDLTDDMLHSLMDEVNMNNDGRLRLDCFLRAADRILGKAPARVVLVVGGPGSGKGALCERLAADCSAVHLSCGEMLREEVEAQTPLGKEVQEIMDRGDLVSSAVVTALMRRRMRQHPGRRILLDGFPRSLENARDFVQQCGPPELALHLDCDDTILLERILARGGQSAKDAERAEAEGKIVNVRADDNVHTAIQRLKNYHKHHSPTMSWLKEIKVPIVELDCSGSKDDVWGQLMAIGRLMRPAVKLPPQATEAVQPQQQQVAQTTTIINGSSVGQQKVNEDLQWIA